MHELIDASLAAWLRARSLSCALTVTSETAGLPGTAVTSGVFRYRAGNRVRVTLEGELNGERFSTRLVCDGTTARVVGRRGASDHRASDNFSDILRAVTHRSGFFMGLRQLFLDSPRGDLGGTTPDDFAMATGFVSEGCEEVRGREARVVAYSLLVPWMKDVPGSVRVWIDGETALPLALVLRVPNHRGAPITTLSEVYSDWLVDAPIGDEEFRLDDL